MFEVETWSIGRGRFRLLKSLVALWQGRPVVVSGICEIRPQIVEGEMRGRLDYLRLIRCVLERSAVRAAA